MWCVRDTPPLAGNESLCGTDTTCSAEMIDIALTSDKQLLSLKNEEVPWTKTTQRPLFLKNPQLSETSDDKKKLDYQRNRFCLNITIISNLQFEISPGLHLQDSVWEVSLASYSNHQIPTTRDLIRTEIVKRSL